ncbi:hypothetical protein ACFL6U_12600 [Planctomycetota bacterium]
MKHKYSHSESILLAESVPYCELPLVELTRRIGFESDRAALQELHQNRPLFNYRGERSLLLGTFLGRLKESNLARKWAGFDVMTLEKAFDLAVDKLSNWPEKHENRQHSHKSNGPDCRYYFRAFYDYTATAISKMDLSGNEISIELIAAKNLERMVLRHFYLSCLESKRRAQRSVRRYFWKIRGTSLCLWMPSMLSGTECRQWLENNIPDVSPHDPSERYRVQAIVDRVLGRSRIISLETLDDNSEFIAVLDNTLEGLIEKQITAHGLAQTVATEKTENIEYQRPAIRNLGKDKLKQLILAIFENITCSDYSAKNLATAFHISDSTFSRFAGSQWKSSQGHVTRTPPDLWRNAAEVLSHHPGFIEAAKSKGLIEEDSANLSLNDYTRGGSHE